MEENDILKPINVCSDCDYCKITNIIDSPYAIAECKQLVKINTVTGEKIYEDCNEARKRIGNHCPMFKSSNKITTYIISGILIIWLVFLCWLCNH